MQDLGKGWISSSADFGAGRYWHYPSLDALIFGGGGLGMLLIGSWFPAPRLNISGVQLDLIVMAAIALLATLGTIKLSTLKALALLQLPLLLLGVSLLWSPSPLAGVDNLTTLIFTSSLAFILLNTVVERYGEEELARVLLLFLAGYLVAAIAYKLVFGLFDRQVLFFMNGPIVFGRFMSIALVLSLINLRGKARVIAVGIFYLAIIWTESKGPILAATVTAISAAMYFAGRGRRLKVAAWVLTIFVLLFAVVNYFEFTRADIGRLAALLYIATGEFTAVTLTFGESITEYGRIDAWLKTLDTIKLYPFGVGLGGWANYVVTEKNFPYAHNLFLEIWSEGGIILGTIACLPLLLFFVVRRSVFWFIALVLFLAQMVSGNLGDARLMYAFSLLACLSTGPQSQDPDAL